MSAGVAAQQRSFVTYTAPVPSLGAPTVTLLEARSVLAFSGTTGLRTWEAALFFGKFLFSSNGRNLIRGKRIIELGAGTGFLSVLCAKHLDAQYVHATDGSERVMHDLHSNIVLNGLDGSNVIGSSILKWGDVLHNDVLNGQKNNLKFDLILGADVVSKFFLCSQIFGPILDKISFRFSDMFFLIYFGSTVLTVDVVFNNFH